MTPTAHRAEEELSKNALKKLAKAAAVAAKKAAKAAEKAAAAEADAAAEDATDAAEEPPAPCASQMQFDAIQPSLKQFEFFDAIRSNR